MLDVKSPDNTGEERRSKDRVTSPLRDSERRITMVFVTNTLKGAKAMRLVSIVVMIAAWGWVVFNVVALIENVNDLRKAVQVLSSETYRQQLLRDNDGLYYELLAARLREQSARKAYEEVASGESTRTLDVNI